ncbi:hypothetical protein [[Eubacterium] cellulosolvens]
MAMGKRTKFYIGVIILAVAIIFLALLLFQGPHTTIPETSVEVIYDSPKGPGFTDIEPGDSIEIKFESTEPVNVILLKPEDYGKYFVLEDTSVEHTVFTTDATSGTINHEFNESGTWKLYFENPTPPPRKAPVVKYWGTLKKQSDDLLFYYLNITVCIILIILALVIINSSRTRKGQRIKDQKSKKKNER